MNIIIFLLIAAAIAGGGYYFLVLKKKKVDEVPVDVTPTRPKPPVDYLPPDKPGTPIKSPPPSYKGPSEVAPKPPEAGSTGAGAIKQAPKPEKPAPAGWFRNGQFIFRNPDPDALWNASVARRVERIDFALVGDGKVLPEQDLGNVRLDRLALNVFKMPDTNFSATMSLTAYLTKASMFLCDKTGKVYDFAVAAEGKTSGGVFITYKAGSIEGGPYVVQASDGISAGSTFSRPRGRRS